MLLHSSTPFARSRRRAFPAILISPTIVRCCNPFEVGETSLLSNVTPRQPRLHACQLPGDLIQPAWLSWLLALVGWFCVDLRVRRVFQLFSFPRYTVLYGMPVILVVVAHTTVGLGRRLCLTVSTGYCGALDVHYDVTTRLLAILSPSHATVPPTSLTGLLDSPTLPSHVFVQACTPRLGGLKPPENTLPPLFFG